MKNFIVLICCLLPFWADAQLKNSPPNPAPGKCYVQCASAPLVQTKDFTYPVFTGKDDGSVALEKVTIEMQPKIGRWEYKPSPGPCRSADPNDCLMLCYVEQAAVTKNILVVKDTSQTQEFESQTFTVATVIDKSGKASWEEIDCKLTSFTDIPVSFASGSPRLDGESRSIIDKNLLQLMRNKPNIRIEINAHTDSRGNADDNLKLSQARAEAVADYLITRGIQRSRMVAKGLGETRLKNRCEDGVDCSGKKHLENVRMEFKVLGGH